MLIMLSGDNKKEASVKVWELKVWFKIVIVDSKRVVLFEYE